MWQVFEIRCLLCSSLNLADCVRQFSSSPLELKPSPFFHHVLCLPLIILLSERALGAWVYSASQPPEDASEQKGLMAGDCLCNCAMELTRTPFYRLVPNHLWGPHFHFAHNLENGIVRYVLVTGEE